MCWPQQAAASGYLNLQDPFLHRHGSQRTANTLDLPNHLRRLLERYIVEGTNKAEIRLGEQCENMESCREILWNEIQVKGP